jgi:sugar phosphate isomerase/epimerase
MKLGAMEHVVHGSDEADGWTKAAALGIQGIEVEVRPAHVRGGATARVAELQKLKVKCGMETPSICLGFHNDAGFVAQPQRAAECAAEITEAVKLCHQISASALLIPFFFKNDPKGDPAKLKNTADILRPICATAQSLGVSICYEGTLDANDLHTMAKQIGSPAFGVYFDLANVVWVGMDGPQQIRALGKLIRQVHMKETKVGPGDARPGDGRVNYTESAKALKEIGYNDWLMLETPAGEPASVAQDIAFTGRYFPLSNKL